MRMNSPTIEDLIFKLENTNPATHTEHIKELTEVLNKNKDLLWPFLMRPFEAVRISERGQLIISEYERLLYTALEYSGNLVPYRGYPRQIKGGLVHPSHHLETFYESGSKPNESGPLLPQLADGEFYKINEPATVYSIRSTLDAFDLEIESPASGKPILIIPSWTDPHATLTINVLDQDRRRVLAAMFLNSSISEGNYQYFESRFNLEDYSGYALKEGEYQKLTGKFPAYVKGEKLDKKTIFCNWKIPLIDCSQNLQTEKSDLNCALYAQNYLQAIVQMLNRTEVVGEILNAANTLFENPEDTLAIESLKLIFKEHI